MFVARVERTCACGTRFCGNQLLRSDLRGCIGWTLLTCKLRSGLQASFVRLAFILVVTMLRGLKLRCIYGLLFQQFRKTPYTLETTSLLPTMVASGLTSASISTMFASPLLAVEGTCICGKLLGYQESLGYKGWRLLMCKSRLLWMWSVYKRASFASTFVLVATMLETWKSDRCYYGLLLQHMPAGTQHIGNHKLGANDGCSANS